MKIPIWRLIVRKLRKAIAIVEETDTCTHTGGLAVGKYVLWKGDLYKVTTARNYGDPLSLSYLEAVSDGIANDISNKFSTDIVSGDLADLSEGTYTFRAMYQGLINNLPNDYAGTGGSLIITRNKEANTKYYALQGFAGATFQNMVYYGQKVGSSSAITWNKLI